MFQCEFSNFFKCALDVMWSLKMTSRLGAAIKGWRVTRFVVPVFIHVSPSEKDN